MSDPRDYKLELSGMTSQERQDRTPRPFIGVHFACCGAYSRIYRAPRGDAYSGHCPRCGKPVRFAIGSGGTDCRYFTVC